MREIFQSTETIQTKKDIFQGFITTSFQKSCQNFVPQLKEQFCQQCHHPQAEAVQRERVLALRRPAGQGGAGGGAAGPGQDQVLVLQKVPSEGS